MSRLRFLLSNDYRVRTYRSLRLLAIFVATMPVAVSVTACGGSSTSSSATSSGGSSGGGGGGAGGAGGEAGGGGGGAAPTACSNAPATPTVLTAAPSGGSLFASSLASDGTTLYLAANAGTLSSLPVTGGPLTTLASDQAASDDFPSVVVLDGSVYFGGAELIERLNPTAHAFDVIVNQQTSGALVAGMTAGADSVYWTNSLELGAQSAHTGSVNRLTTSSGKAAALATQLNDPGEIAVDNANVYWVDELGSIDAMPLAGGTVTTLVDNQQGIDGLAAGGGFVYWTNDSADVSTCGLCPPPPPPKIGDGTLDRIAASGGSTSALSLGYGGGAVALDAKYAYWSDGTNITAVPLDGGAPIVLAHEGAWVGPIVDACRVYWVTDDNSAIKSVAKPR
jgi:hypothetical protein